MEIGIEPVATGAVCCLAEIEHGCYSNFWETDGRAAATRIDRKELLVLRGYSSWKSLDGSSKALPEPSGSEVWLEVFNLAETKLRLRLN